MKDEILNVLKMQPGTNVTTVAGTGTAVSAGVVTQVNGIMIFGISLGELGLMAGITASLFGMITTGVRLYWQMKDREK